MSNIQSLETGKQWTWSPDDVRELDRSLVRLRIIARKLQKYHEDACNYGLTSRQEKNEGRLKEEAESIARDMGFGLYVQGDPRGCPLYLIPREWTQERADQEYTHGLAISG